MREDRTKCACGRRSPGTCAYLLSLSGTHRTAPAHLAHRPQPVVQPQVLLLQLLQGTLPPPTLLRMQGPPPGEEQRPPVSPPPPPRRQRALRRRVRRRRRRLYLGWWAQLRL